MTGKEEIAGEIYVVTGGDELTGKDEITGDFAIKIKIYNIHNYVFCSDTMLLLNN